MAGLSTVHRVRRVLAISPFRRLWAVTYVCSTADWLSLLALSSFATKLAAGYTAQNFAFSGVVLTQLLPGLVFAPAGGLLADRFDRRKVMIVCDLLRCALLLSIAVVGSQLWLFAGNFLVGCCAMLWIPSKDAAVPNLLRRPDQVETANQLGLVMTYGVAVISGAGLFAVVTGVTTALHLPLGVFGPLGLAKVALFINGLLFLASAVMVARIPELSQRDVPATTGQRDQTPGIGLLGMFRDGARFIRSTPLVRGLLIGMAGAFAAGGAVVGSALPYASSLGGGDPTFALLLVAVFVGLSFGMAAAPKFALRLAHDRLFGVAIVFAGLALAVVAVSPHLVLSLVAVAFVGTCAGVAFLTGVTVIGSKIEDGVRGRINAIYQLLMKVILFGSTLVVPLLIGLVQRRVVTVWGKPVVVDGTRPVLLGGGLLAALVGVIAYRQMDARRNRPLLADLRNAIRRRTRNTTGLLIAVEGTFTTNTSDQAERLAEWLRGGGGRVEYVRDPVRHDAELTELITGSWFTGRRSRALFATAVRADLVERTVLPVLDDGGIVVMERFIDSPLAHFSTVAELDFTELDELAEWATGGLRPDVTLVLEANDGTGGAGPPDRRWQVQHLLTELAAADPDRYLVVDADGTDDDIAKRVRQGLLSVPAARRSGLLPA